MFLNKKKFLKIFLSFFRLKLKFFFPRFSIFSTFQVILRLFYSSKKVHHFFDDFATKNENFGCSRPSLYVSYFGFIANEDFWSPPPLPPLSDRFCKKSEKIRIDSEWPETARNRKKKFCPLVTPPPKKTLKNFQIFFLKIFQKLFRII